MTNSLDTVLGSTVYGPDQEKIGKVKEIYIGNETGYPTWASVSTGWFSADSLVPLAGATHKGDSLQVAVGKETVKAAPHLDAGEAITPREEQELLRHYGVDADRTGWDTYGRHAATPPPTGNDTPRRDRSVADTPTSGEGISSGTEPLVRSEERLDIDTERRAAGTARLRKYVVTEQQSVEVPVSHEEVRVVREPISNPAQANAPRLSDDEREITLHEDRVTVDKETVPVEKVRLAVDTVSDTETVTEEVRKEQIDTTGLDREERHGRQH